MASLNSNPNFAPFMAPIKGVRMELYGDWKKFGDFIKYLGGGKFNRGIKRDLAKGQRDYLTLFKKSLITGLTTEGRSVGHMFQPHASNYKGSSTIGVRSGVYLRALRNLRITQVGYSVSLQFSPNDLRRKSRSGGLILSKYASIFETGNRMGQPARPLWASTYTHIGGSKKLISYMQGGVKRGIERLGIKFK